MTDPRTKPMSECPIDQLAEEIEIRSIENYNKEASRDLLQNWCINVSENMKEAREATDLSEFIKDNNRYNASRLKDAIVVGASPDLTDEEIMEIDPNKVDVIITNKNFERFYNLGVFPAWVCLIDAHPISNMQFSFLNKFDMGGPPYKLENSIKFLISTTVYPSTLNTIMTHSDWVYMFNPVTDFGGQVRLSKTWAWMNDRDELQHGGSVGGLAITLATMLNYERIGLLGFGLCEKGSPEWTIEESKSHDHIYYPDTNEYVSIPRHFKAYLAYLMEVVRTNKSKFYNLSNSPVLRHSPMLGQTDVKEFIKGGIE